MARSSIQIDAAIVGGGIAGLWLLNVLRGRGYSVVLLESGRLGGGQTLASQGLIHGGLKYALGGALTSASEAIAGMPARWRACLAGAGEVDLSSLRPLAERIYLFGQGGTLGALGGFFASKALRGRIRRLTPPEFPCFLAKRAVRELVYEIDDFVLDPVSLVRRLAELGAPHIYQAPRNPVLALRDQEAIIEVGVVRISCGHLILAAGQGNEDLLRHLNMLSPMQRRPLHQVVLRHPDAGPFFGHCLSGPARPTPRLTITTHPDGQGKWLWSIGGQLATHGVRHSAAAQRQRTRRELQTCAPWIDWSKADIQCFRIDRAEPRQPWGRRPDAAFAKAQGRCIVCWPTKLTLAPDLGDKVGALLPAPAHPAPPPLDLPPAQVGAPPWVR